jgi:light-regulated signal transduction histidine kinase (bacteriophytochrome)
MSNRDELRTMNDALARNNLLLRMTNRIRRSLELQEILSATVTEMRSFLETDRVKIYRFDTDGTGQVIAEATDTSRLPALIGLHFPATDIPPHAREMFVKARQRSIISIPQQQITLSRMDCPETTGDLTLEDLQQQPITDILQRPVDPCHVEYLTAMGVQSSLVLPLLHQQNLWGLLVSHHATPKEFAEEDLQIVQLFADQVSIAISQSHLLSQTREKARREALVNQISTLLHAPLRIQEILQIVLERIVRTVAGAGGRLYLTPTNSSDSGELYACGSQPVLASSGKAPPLEAHQFWQPFVDQGFDNRFSSLSDAWEELLLGGHEMTIASDANSLFQAIPDIYQHPQLIDLASVFQPTRIRSMIVMPLRYGGQSLGCLTIFRNEINTDILWAGRFDPDDRQDRVRSSFEVWRELKSGQAKEWTSYEIELVQALGTHLTMAIMQNRLYQCEREQRGLVEMRIQELNTAKVVAEEASRLKSDFLSSTSHELRTPLASTLNYLKLLHEGFYDNEEELKEYIAVAYQSAENLVAIINDVLDIAKIEAGRMSVTMEVVNLAKMLEEQQTLFRLESRRKGIPLVVDCPIEQVYADQVKLRQILTNLLSNAFKFTNQGEVRVQVQKIKQDGRAIVKIAVSDTGIGIDTHKQDLVFEPFVQEDGSIKRRYGGTGLGLTVCKRLVELMNGQICLASKGKGQGTTVSFTLPGIVG